MASVKWRLAQCAQRAGDAKQCSNLMGAVQDYCEERTDRLPSYGKHAGTVDRLRAALAAELRKLGVEIRQDPLRR